MPHIKILLPHQAAPVLRPLLDAYAARNISWELGYVSLEKETDQRYLHSLSKDCSAMLLIGNPALTPAKVLPGPVLCTGDHIIPVGWLPFTNPEDIAVFAQTAAAIHLRDTAVRDVAVLGQWLPRFSHLAERIHTILSEKETHRIFKWTSDVVYKEDMIKGLHAGIAAAIYVGHGRPIGWVGYYGTRIHEMAGKRNEPLSSLISLSCLTASRRRTEISFAEWLPLKGVAASALGAINATVHSDNTRWAVNLCTAMNGESDSIGDLIVSSLPERKSAVSAYRLIGDPLSPLRSAAAAHAKAKKIRVFN